jgi:chromosome segregation ATPase
MPKLTREKENSIQNTFLNYKEFKTTAKVEGVDWRTVKRVINKSDQDRSLVVEDTELEKQLAANRLFKKGCNSATVSEQLRIRPIDAIRFRKEFDEMLKFDFDYEIAKKTARIEDLERTSREYENRLKERKRILAEIQTRAIAIHEEIRRAETYYGRLKEDIKIAERNKQQIQQEVQDLKRKVVEFQATLHRLSEKKRQNSPRFRIKSRYKTGLGRFVWQREPVHVQVFRKYSKSLRVRR